MRRRGRHAVNNGITGSIGSKALLLKFGSIGALTALSVGLGVAGHYASSGPQQVSAYSSPSRIAQYGSVSRGIARDEILTEADERTTQAVSVAKDVSWGGLEQMDVPVTMSTSETNALKALKEKLGRAKELHRSSAGRVQSDDNRSHLKTVVDRVSKFVSGDNQKESESRKLSSELDAVMAVVRDDIKAKEQADAVLLRTAGDTVGITSTPSPVIGNGITAAQGLSRPTVKLPESQTGNDVVEFAMQFIGSRYVWGGTDPATGVDCSGLTMYVFSHFGVQLPHYSGAQAGYGRAIGSLAEAKPGDLIANGVHAAIYIGDGKVVNALNPSEGVKVTGINVFSGGYSIRRLVE